MYAGSTISPPQFPSLFFFLQMAISRGSYTGVDRAQNIAAFPTIIAHVSSVVGHAVQFFTSIPYTSDRLTSKVLVLLYTADLTIEPRLPRIKQLYTFYPLTFISSILVRTLFRDE